MMYRRGTARREFARRRTVAPRDREAANYRQRHHRRLVPYTLDHIGVASYGALGHVPPSTSTCYFGDHSLYRLWRVIRTVFCPVERFLAIGSADCHWIVALLCSRKNFKRTNTENVQKQRDFCAIFINFWPIFVIFFLPTVFLRE